MDYNGLAFLNKEPWYSAVEADESESERERVQHSTWIV